ncbi:RPII140-upstream gene protein-like [Oppia nitens]|uniref:RPII140-upstream gene protein-like n=1 Tax=Oppia nitens TaxID=1686743 RepID=UPI0023DC85C5|nr:RPII140-upstream gene protein-like [Oppia nitens]
MCLNNNYKTSDDNNNNNNNNTSVIKTVCRLLTDRIGNRFAVFAASAATADDDNIIRDNIIADTDIPTTDDNNNKKFINEFDNNSKAYTDFIGSLTIWQSIKYLYQRKVDTSADDYRRQFVKDNETGYDRIRLMWSEHLDGEDNPEISFIMQSVAYGAMGGFLYGGLVNNKAAIFDFVRRHNDYVFRGHFEGQRRIRDAMFINLGRHGWRWCWRMALFSGVLSTLTTTAITYRNDIYYRDCCASGALLCAAWKMKLGLRAMAVSGVLGSIIGALFASGAKLAIWSFNTSVPEYRHWRHVRYQNHLAVHNYSDGNSEYKWRTDNQKDSVLLYQPQQQQPSQPPQQQTGQQSNT